MPVIASGGVASLDDLAALSAVMGEGIEGVIIGRALCDGRVDPDAALAPASAWGDNDTRLTPLPPSRGSTWL